MRSLIFANEEWNQLGIFKKMKSNKEKFIRTKSDLFLENEKLDTVEEQNEQKDSCSDSMKEEEERKVREESIQNLQVISFDYLILLLILLFY